MEYRALGPLEVADEQGPVALGTVKERLVLAALLLRANEVVSRDQLIEELWGDSPPPSPRESIFAAAARSIRWSTIPSCI